MDTLGERIRRLRKNQKMTLQELAGDKMSKGMLSLIENNKAKPSMESLSHIAAQLGVSTSELLEEVSMQELRQVLEQAEAQLEKRTNAEEARESGKKIIRLIGPYLERLGEEYESARILEIYSRALHLLGLSGWEKPAGRAAAIYESLNITSRLAAIGMFRAQTLFSNHDYAGALDVLLKERRAIESRETFIDPITRIDFDYTEAVLHYAVGDTENALRVMDCSLAYSREQALYYHVSDWYRLASTHSLMAGNMEDYTHYKKKLRLFAEFAEDPESVGFLIYLDIHELNSYKRDHTGALLLLRQNEHPGLDTQMALLEEGKALSGLGRHEEAVEKLSKIDNPEEQLMHHPIDRSLFLEGEAYFAESLQALGLEDEARDVIRKAHQHISQLSKTPYKDRVEKAFQRIIR